MNRFLLGALAMGAVFAASSFSVRSAASISAATTGPLKLSDLTVEKARRFSVPSPVSFVVPPNGAFVLTDASSFGDLLIVINGYTRARLPASAVLRNFDPPIVVQPGDTFALSGTGDANLGGYVVAPADVAPTVPSAPVPLALKDFSLDRAEHFFVLDTSQGWALTNPAAASTSIVLVGWYGHPAFFDVDGSTVAQVGVNTIGAKDYRFGAPIIVAPGQTLTVFSTIPGFGELGGFLAYPGET